MDCAGPLADRFKMRAAEVAAGVATVTITGSLQAEVNDYDQRSQFDCANYKFRNKITMPPPIPRCVRHA